MIKCPKCGKKNSSKDSFCEKCGKKLKENKNLSNHEEFNSWQSICKEFNTWRKSKKIRKTHISLVIVSTLLVLVSVLFLIKIIDLDNKNTELNNEKTELNNQITDLKQEITSLEEQICEQVCEVFKEPYVESTSYTYTFKYAVVSDSTEGIFLEGSSLNWGTEQTTRIKNFDNKKGYFTVKHNYRTLKKQGDEEISYYLDSGETKDFITTFDTSFGEDVEVTTDIIPPTETRNKEVIKYKEVERCYCKQ